MQLAEAGGVSGGWPSATSSSSSATGLAPAQRAAARPGRWPGGRGSPTASRLVTRACSGASGSPVGRRDRVEDGVEQRREVGVVGRACRRRRTARPSRATAEMTGKSMWWSPAPRSMNSCVDLVEHLVGPGVAAVDLVDDDDAGQVEGERLRAARSGSGAAGPRRRRRAAARRRPSPAPARPRRRSRRGPACRPG